MNCDAAFVDGKAAFAIVARDDDGLLVVAMTKLVRLSFAYEAKIKSIGWASAFASGKPWNNLNFSSDALAIVREIKSSKEPSCWFTRDSVLCIRYLLFSKNWDLSWEC